MSFRKLLKKKNNNKLFFLSAILRNNFINFPVKLSIKKSLILVSVNGKVEICSVHFYGDSNHEKSY